MSVALSESALAPYLAKLIAQDSRANIVVGCLHSPQSTTMTGSSSSIDAMKTLMDQDKIFARKLDVGVAYHSPSMRKIAAEYAALIHDITPERTQKKDQTLPVMYSSVTGDLITTRQLSLGAYWVENMVSKVRFSEALTQMCSATIVESCEQPLIDMVIEIGPHAALRKPIKDTVDAMAMHNTLDYDSALVRGTPATQTAMEMAGRLHCKGYGVDLLAVNSSDRGASERTMRTDLPEYPFNHSQTYWLESRLSKNYRFREHARHELLGTRSPDWNPLDAKWRNIIKSSENPWVEDHKVHSISFTTHQIDHR